MKETLYKFTGTEHTNEGWQAIPLEVGCSYCIGDFEKYEGSITEDLRKNLFVLPALMQGSDYSGGSIQRSNKRSFLKKYEKTEGVYEVYGGYNTYGVAIRLDIYESKEIKDVFDALENYPLIDDEDHTQLKDEWEGQYMKNILIDELCKDIKLEAYIPEWESLLEDKEAIELIAWDGVNE